MAIRASRQVDISDITDAYSAWLTAPSMTIPGSEDGSAIATSVKTQVMARLGADTVQASVDAAKCECPAGVSVASDGDVTAPTLTISFASSVKGQGTVSVPVTVDGIAGFELVFAFAVARRGAAGTSVTVTSTKTEYQKGASGTTVPSGTWLPSMPELEQGEYGWSRCTTTYSDGKSAETYSVSYRGIDGVDGTSVTVRSTAVQYQAAAQGSDPAKLSGAWRNEVPDISQGEWLWTRTQVTYSDGKSTVAYGTSRNGVDGAAGKNALTMSITSSDGLIFKNTAISTTLTAHVYSGGYELTDVQVAEIGQIKWYKDGGTEAVATGRSIVVKAGDVVSHASYLAQLEGDGDTGDVGGNGSSVPLYNETTGRYYNETIARWLRSANDGKAYGVSVPAGQATACVKTGANAGMSAPTPGAIGRPAKDPYSGVGPFRFVMVNGGVDPDGTPYVTAIEGDGRFSRTEADVWQLAPVLYWSRSETASATEVSVSDSKLAGMEPQPQAYLPSGDLRPYMLHAAYWLGEGDGCSRSGQPADLFDVSHNSLIAKMGNATTGYSACSYEDYWYGCVMRMLKYATKDFQFVMRGCTDYAVDVAASQATSGQKYVVVSNEDAAKLVVGSTVSVGTRQGYKSDARQEACTRDIADRVRIISIERHDDKDMRVVLDVGEAFDVPAGSHVVTMPWRTGSCDMVEGDGSPTSCTSGKEPYKLQGIEYAGGFYEILGDVIFHQASSGPGEVYVNPDSRGEKAAYDASVYVDTGLALPEGDGVWPLGIAFSPQGVIVPKGAGGSSSSGLCDAKYGGDFTGDREFLSGGHLWDGSHAGPWSVYARFGLGVVWWDFGSRASATGRGVRTA